MTPKPLAVVISDVHYSLSTLDLADTAFRAAIDKAAELKVPLIDAGDLTNDKAILRGEVVNKLIETMKYALKKKVNIHLIVGNHSLINEKSENHVLNFLQPYANVVPWLQPLMLGQNIYLLAYQNSPEKFKAYFDLIPKGSLVITHQGYKGAYMGDYVVDKTSVDPEELKDYKIFSGHYHRHQTIGSVTYIGSPYTITFGEANDGPKGFLILNIDGSFERVILNLRKHIKLEVDTKTKFRPTPLIQPNDLLWLKVKGPLSELKRVNKTKIGEVLLGHSNFKLDLIPTENGLNKEFKTNPLSGEELILHLIDNLNETKTQKELLKELYYEVIDN